jgi:multiple RNA-binding domain-containing protein 1
MAPASKSKTWANEDLTTFGQGAAAPAMDTVAVVEAGESDDEYESIPVKKKEKKEPKEKAPESRPQEDVEMGGAGETKETEAVEAEPAAPVSDADWLRSKTSRLLDLTDDVDAEIARVSLNDTTTTQAPPLRAPAAQSESEEWKGIDEEMTEPAKAEESEEEEKGTTEEEAAFETISKSGRLFLRNLSYSVTEDDLREHFKEHGDLEEVRFPLLGRLRSMIDLRPMIAKSFFPAANNHQVHLPIDNKTNASKGFAYVQYTNPIDAVEAFKHLDRKIFQGRLLHILPSAPKRENRLDEYALSKLPLKKQRELKKKAGAATSQFNWNSMYMSADAVMSSVADRLGVPKAELLDPTSSDAAVRQAHAETHVIQETKAYFRAQGIDLNTFNKKDRDDKVILIKNFPYGTKIDELRKMLSEFGQLGRVLMPPSGTIAIAEFLAAPAARVAFAGLAYRRFKDSVLFLEKAPRGLFTASFDPTQSNPNATQLAAAAAISSAAKDAKLSAGDLLSTEDASADTSTLFVRNLNFSTTSALLADTFRPIDGFMSARVKTKTDPKKPGQVLSMGFGFVEFRTKAAAEAALSAMDGFVLEGHKLLIKASHKGLDAAAERKKADTAKKDASKRTKIIIKNLPFEASKKDIRALFGHYGTLRTVRVPKKFGGATRGFAFAEFVTSREAEGAMEALKDTHLLGRRLVLEYAAQEAADAEEEIERMGEKVARQTGAVALHKLRADRKRKVEIAGDGGVEEEM